MPALTVYKLRNPLDGVRVHDFDTYLAEDREPDAYEVLQIPGGEVKLYVWSSFPRPPRWESFVRTGWDNASIPPRAPVGALITVRILIDDELHYFGLPFGMTGRFLLDQSAIERAYGLRTALNIMYPRSLGTSETEGTRLVSLDAKRRSKDTMRSRLQSAREATFEMFDIDQLRDVVNAATGRPTDVDSWGYRITGADGLTFSADISVSELPDLCQRIEAAHRQDDYRARFGWIDNVQPVNDPDLLGHLQQHVVDCISRGDVEEFDLAPPEIVAWESVDVFRFHVDGHQGTNHRQLRLKDYRRALQRVGSLDDLSYARLKNGFVKALDGDGTTIHRWSIWRSLVGTFNLDGRTYILDEGEFFTVSDDYLFEIDQFIDSIGESASLLPRCGLGLREEDYNRAAADEVGALLLDRENITIPGRTTAVELCDLLTEHRELIHVKREFGSRDLSHLFGQGTTAAELIQEAEDFRGQAQKKVIELAGDERFAFFADNGINPPDFCVTFAVIGDWSGKPLSERLPFFSKVNLRRAARDLRRRGFQVAFKAVDQDH